MSQVPWPPAKSRVGSCAFLGCLPDAGVTWKAIRYQKKDQELRSVARISMDFLRSFSGFKPRLVLTIKSGWRVAVVVTINWFMPKFCAAFGRYLTLDSLDLMAWECWDDWDSLFFMLHLFGQTWVSFCRGRFLFSNLERRNELRLVQSERFLGRLACEDVLPHGTGIWERPHAVHLRGSRFAWHGHLHSSHRTVLPRGFDEISWNVLRRTSRSRWVSDFIHPRPVQAHGCGWSETKTSRRSHRCYSEFSLQVKHAALFLQMFHVFKMWIW